MRRAAFALLACLLAGPSPSEAASRINDARKLYNQELYELAIKAAHEAREAGDSVDEASLIFARAHLERFRQTRDAQNLSEAQSALRAVDATLLSQVAQTEFTLALGE